MAEEPAENQLTEDQLEDLQRDFDEFDTDASGYITTQELPTVMRAVGLNPTDQQIDEFMFKYDEEGDGMITFDEFKKIYVTLKIDPEDQKKKLRKAFEVFDKDGNGYLDVNEFKEIMADKISDENEFDEIITRCDKDGNGRINYDEFIDWMMENNTKQKNAETTEW